MLNGTSSISSSQNDTLECGFCVASDTHCLHVFQLKCYKKHLKQKHSVFPQGCDASGSKSRPFSVFLCVSVKQRRATTRQVCLIISLSTDWQWSFWDECAIYFKYTSEILKWTGLLILLISSVLTCASISCRLIWVRVMLEKSMVSENEWQSSSSPNNKNSFSIYALMEGWVESFLSIRDIWTSRIKHGRSQIQ